MDENNPGRVEKSIPENISQISKVSNHLANQLIVKLKDGSSLDDIKELNYKYNVTSIEKVFKDAPTPEDTIPKLKDELSNSIKHQSWYWQINKDSQEYEEYIKRLNEEKEQLSKQILAQEKLIAKIEQRKKRRRKVKLLPN